MSDEIKDDVPVDFFMALASSADAVNGYAVLGLTGQQFMLEKYRESQTEGDKEKLLEELKK